MEVRHILAIIFGPLFEELPLETEEKCRREVTVKIRGDTLSEE